MATYDTYADAKTAWENAARIRRAAVAVRDDADSKIAFQRQRQAAANDAITTQTQTMADAMEAMKALV